MCTWLALSYSWASRKIKTQRKIKFFNIGMLMNTKADRGENIFTIIFAILLNPYDSEW